MAYMTFAKTGVTTVTLSRNDTFPRAQQVQTGQLVGESQAGVVIVATTRPVITLLPLHWARMPESDYQALKAFFEHANVNLTAHPFTWTDYDSTSHTVRAWNLEQFYAAPLVTTGLREVTLTLRLEVS